jgi:hypothetical protein
MPVGKDSAPWLPPGPSPSEHVRLADNPVRSADGRQVPRIDHPWRGFLPAYFVGVVIFVSLGCSCIPRTSGVH